MVSKHILHYGFSICPSPQISSWSRIPQSFLKIKMLFYTPLTQQSILAQYNQSCFGSFTYSKTNGMKERPSEDNINFKASDCRNTGNWRMLICITPCRVSVVPLHHAKKRQSVSGNSWKYIALKWNSGKTMLCGSHFSFSVIDLRCSRSLLCDWSLQNVFAKKKLRTGIFQENRYKAWYWASHIRWRQVYKHGLGTIYAWGAC